MEFEPTIGLEVHAQLKTKSKIFCSCSTEFGKSPNENTCPVCLGMPGVLPVLNKKVVESAIRLGLASNCQITKNNRFARKNYFYPDLPKGYQISQYEFPICEHGYIDISVNDTKKRIGITRIHMEEDAGKLVHDSAHAISHVDFNRTGVPLLEIVSEPDITTCEQAGEYLKQLRLLVRYLDICDGNMEEGSFRCDANISIKPVGSEALGTRAEIKNLNSFRNVEKAITFEIKRQKELILSNQIVIQETRLWNPDKEKTTSMRSKEDAHDYRYFPDPDLVPITIDDKWINNLKTTIPELFEEKKIRFISEYKLPVQNAITLTSDKKIADYFEDGIASLVSSTNPNIAKDISNWILGPLLAYINTNNINITKIKVLPNHIGKLVELIDKNIISGKIAKTVFDQMLKTGNSPDTIVKEKNLTQITDESFLDDTINQVLSSNPKEVEAFKNGKTKLMGFFVGQIMKITKGKANPNLVNNILKKKLQ